MRYLLAVLFLFSSVTLAQTTVPYTFVAGTAAKASEVNLDFQALATMIDNVSSRISRLEILAAASVADVAGTYNIVAMGLEVEAPSTANSSVIHSTSSGSLTLNADGTFSWSQSLTDSKLSISMGAPGSTAVTTFSSNEPHTGTWSVSGKLLTLNFFGGPVQAFIGSNVPSLFISTNVDFTGGDLRHTLLFLIHTSPRLESIAVTPAFPIVPLRDQNGALTTTQLTSTGTFSNRTTQDLTTSVAWSSSNTAVATIAANGIASVVGPGTTTINATSVGVSYSTILIVNP